MKAYLTTSVELEGLEELKDFDSDLNIKVIKTSEGIKTKWNPYFRQTWGDFDWLRNLMPGDRDIRCYFTSTADLKAKKITSHYGMYDLTDNDGIIDFYAGIPKRLDKRAKKNGFKTNLAWLFIHETCHGLEQKAGVKDSTHTMDEQGRLKELYLKHKERNALVVKVGLLQRILELTKVLFSLKKKTPKLIHPIELYKDYVSQGYGVKNSIYKATGRHIGIDYACPANTNLVAPYDGEVIKSGSTKVLGNYCHYQYNFNGIIYIERYLHLSVKPNKGRYLQGSIVALTGNTGMSTGNHLHQDIWVGEVRLALINKTNWNLLTVNPEIHYNL